VREREKNEKAEARERQKGLKVWEKGNEMKKNVVRTTKLPSTSQVQAQSITAHRIE
jgi:hypothetical protein